MKNVCLATFTLALAPSISSAALTMVPATGWNHDIVYGNGEQGGSVSGTMDGGGGFLGNTWYEIGRNTAAPGTGLPNGVITSQTTPDLTFGFQPFAGASNAVLLTTAPNGMTPRNVGALTFTTPASFTRLALIGSTGNGTGNIAVTVNYADTSTQVFNFTNGFAADWYGNSPIALVANGRSTSISTYDSENSGNPRLYETILTLNNTTSNVTSVSFVQSGTGNTAIMAISGEAVPEPSTFALIGAAGMLGLLRRRA